MKVKNTFLFILLVIFGINFTSSSQVTNTFSGTDSGVNSTGNYNSGFGFNSLISVSGHNNSGFGHQTLTITSGSLNSAFGAEALRLNVEGDLNSAFGTRALSNNNSGSRNIAIGHRTLEANISGNNNTSVGYATLIKTQGSNNVALGYQSPRSLLSGNNNVFIGYETAQNLLYGSNNVFLGRVSVSTNPSSTTIAGNTTNGTIIVADGTGKQRIFISQDGNTGIGLGNNVIPVNKLDIKGGVVIGQNYTSNYSVQGQIAPSNGLLVEGRVGIGNKIPNNKVEITHGKSGYSGLRFTNLTSEFVPTSTQVSTKFLSVNATGDVVLSNMANTLLTNSLLSNANVISSNINGIPSSTSIVNSISNNLNSNNQLITTINGVASSPITLPVPTFTEVDSSITNELQTLSQAGNTITLSNNGGSFTLPTFTDTDVQGLTLTGNNLSISNGNTVVLPTFTEVDGSLTNELQTLSQAGNTITLSNNGGSFTLPTFTDTDVQGLTLTGNNLSISNGNTVVLPTFTEVDGSLTNELQTLSQAGNTITLSNNGGSFTLPTFTDNDIQSLTLTGNTLSISNGNTVTLPTLNVLPGNNVTFTGLGTTTSPFLVNAIDTSIFNSNGIINQTTTVNNNRVVEMNDRNIWFKTISSESNGKIYIGANSVYPNSTGEYKLFVEGGVLTEKIKVALRSTANWADYIFEDNYSLMPLNKVEEFIIINKHLPGINSAADLAKNGLDVAEMQSKQMAKIEELTLYIIDQNKTVEFQTKALEKNNKDIEELKIQIKSLIEKTK